MSNEEFDRIGASLIKLAQALDRVLENQEKILAKLERPSPPEYAPYRAVEL